MAYVGEALGEQETVGGCAELSNEGMHQTGY